MPFILFYVGISPPFVFAVVLSVVAADKQRKVAFGKNMNRTAYRPVFHKSFGYSSLVEIIAADFQRVQCIRHKLSLYAAEVARNRQLVGGREKVLVRHLTYFQFFKRHVVSTCDLKQLRFVLEAVFVRDFAYHTAGNTVCERIFGNALRHDSTCPDDRA